MSTEVHIDTTKKPDEHEPEKKVTTTTETEQAVSNEPQAPVVKTTERETHTEK